MGRQSSRRPPILKCMTDQSWADFREETFGDAYMVWHDGPDFTELVERWEADPELVERMLLAGIADDDPLASQDDRRARSRRGRQAERSRMRCSRWRRGERSRCARPSR